MERLEPNLPKNKGESPFKSSKILEKKDSLDKSLISRLQECIDQGKSPFLRNSEDVRALQLALKNLGYDVGEVDGVWGEKTKSGVKSFQRSVGIRADGAFGPQTFLKIKEAFGVKSSVSERSPGLTVKLNEIADSQYENFLKIIEIYGLDRGAKLPSKKEVLVYFSKLSEKQIKFIEDMKEPKLLLVPKISLDALSKAYESRRKEIPNTAEAHIDDLQRDLFASYDVMNRFNEVPTGWEILIVEGDDEKNLVSFEGEKTLGEKLVDVSLELKDNGARLLNSRHYLMLQMAQNAVGQEKDQKNFTVLGANTAINGKPAVFTGFFGNTGNAGRITMSAEYLNQRPNNANFRPAIKVS